MMANQRLSGQLRTISVEPLGFVYAVCYAMMDVTRQDFLYKVEKCAMIVVYNDGVS